MGIPTNTVTAFDAKNRLGRLLDRVEGGEVVIITRHGEPVARLSPIDSRTDDQVQSALETFREVRESIAGARTKVTGAEIKKWRAEGRR